MDVAYDQAREALRAHLSEKSFAHSERTAETAGALAARFGVDVEKARLAGLLHDWGRDMSADALLAVADRVGLEVTDADAAEPYLLHGAVSAAEVGRAIPGLPGDVLAAIASHTFGAKDMDALAKVVYLADTIEPGRTKHDVAGLRDAIEAAGTLDGAFETAYARTISTLVKRRRLIHPRTVEVWNALVAGGRT